MADKDRRRQFHKRGEEPREEDGASRHRRSRRDDDGHERRERRRRRRGSSEPSDGEERKGHHRTRDREEGRGRERRAAADDDEGKQARGFKPAPWMASGGPRPGELSEKVAAAHAAEKVKPEIFLCQMNWEDHAAMDARVGGLIPHTSAKALSERFAEIGGGEAEMTEEESEEASARQQLRHFAQLHELGVPVELLLSNLRELCDKHGIELTDPEPLIDDGGRRNRRRFSHHDKDSDIVENVWEEVPVAVAQAGRNLVRNSESTVLLVTLIPVDLNVEEKLREHFGQFGHISQIIPRVNFRPGARYADQGMALIEMGSERAARMACQAPDAVCGNRFIKVFYAPEDARKKVEKMKIEKMLQERTQRMEQQKQLTTKRQQAVAAFAECKQRVAHLRAQKDTLEARLPTVVGEERALLEEEMKLVASHLMQSMQQQLQAMEAIKSCTEQAPQQWKARSYQGAGFNTFYAGTCVFKLPNPPPAWLSRPIRFKRAMERYGEVLGCCIGKTPPQGFVRFKRRPDAKRAVKALEGMKHKPAWIEDNWEAEWPKDEELYVEEVEPAPAPAAMEEPKDEDEALIEAELGLRNEEIIPEADAGGEDGEAMAEA